MNVSPSILCSAPSELIRLWRAIYLYRWKRGKVPIFTLLFPPALQPLHMDVCFWRWAGLLSAEAGNGCWDKIDLHDIAECYRTAVTTKKVLRCVFTSISLLLIFMSSCLLGCHISFYVCLRMHVQTMYFVVSFRWLAVYFTLHKQRIYSSFICCQHQGSQSHVFWGQRWPKTNCAPILNQLVVNMWGPYYTYCTIWLFTFIVCLPI